MDASFGDRHLRLACPEHEPASSQSQERAWQCFAPLRNAPGADAYVAEYRA